MRSARGADRYDPLDSTFSVYQRGVGTLSVDGTVVGHLASRVLDMSFPSRQPWLWFIIVWLDGSREQKFEDYGPRWWTVRQLDAGRFEHHLPSRVEERRFLGLRFVATIPGDPVVFDFERLAPAAAAQKWCELGLTDHDF
jgi:hypothetical protein